MAARRISVVGVGGAGCRIVGRMSALADDELATMAVDTDTCALAESEAGVRLQIGERQTGGFGAGGDDEKGRLAMEEELGAVLEGMGGAEVAMLVAGLGGGAGSGGIVTLAGATRAAGMFTFCFVTLPFGFEGGQRKGVANRVLDILKDTADVVVAVPSDSLFAEASRELPAVFEQAETVLGGAVAALWQALARPGYINLDFADVRSVASDTDGPCAFGFAEAVGSDKARQAADAFLKSPTLDGGRLLGRARFLLLSIVGGPDLTLREVDTIMKAVVAAAKPEARVIMGTSVDDAWAGRVTLFAILGEKRAARPPVELPPREPAAAAAADAALAAAESAAAAPGGSKTRRQRPKQASLPLELSGRGRFKDVEPTIYNGEDLDVPTFVRRGLRIEK